MPRVSVSGPDDLDPDGRRIWERIASGPRGRVEGPLRIWVKRPALAERAEALGAYCRFGSSLPPRLSELAILITGAHWQASFEWYAHCPLALDAGIAPEVVESIRLGKEPVFDREDEAAAYAFAVELITARRVTDATYRRAVAALGEASVIDLVGLLGYYALVSMTINAFEVALPEGALDPFETT
jgi:4-carboxymuconolactone decarboxylase